VFSAKNQLSQRARRTIQREPMPTDGDRVLERHAGTDPFVLYAGNIKPQKKSRSPSSFAVAKADLRIIRNTQD
jgi:hypothetical protein